MSRLLNSKLLTLRPATMLAAISIALVATGCKTENEQITPNSVVRPVLVESVKSSNVADLTFYGEVQSATRADLSFRTSGRLVEMLVTEGNEVEKGQLIARLDSVDAEIALASAQIERDNASAEYQRAKTLYENRQSISKSQLDELTLRFKLAQNRFLEAERRLEDTKLLAPFSGIVSRTYVNNYVLVQGNEPVVSVHDLNNLEVVINVPERLMARNVETPKIYAEVLSNTDKALELTLESYETEPDPTTGTYAVTLSIESTEDNVLLPGMNVRVFSTSAPISDAQIQLPLTAVLPDNLGNQYVWVVADDNTLEKRVVTTGSLNGDRVLIESNLELGEQVVVSGAQSLEAGLEVRPQTVEAQ